MRLSPWTRPVVGITGPDEGGDAAWWMSAWGVWRAGGWPRRISPASPAGIDALDALILGGGADVAPERYGQQVLSTAPRTNVPSDLGTWAFNTVIGLLRQSMTDASLVRLDPERDALETSLLGQAIARDLPVLGICRGAQLLNVHCGGTLHQELGGFYKDGKTFWTIFPKKQVHLEKGSDLSRIFSRTTLRVNALHNQAVAELGQGLSAAARDTWGVVQAVEMPGKQFILGVQWHPEYMPQVRRQRRLFRAFVDAAHTAR